jgi:hypothetical protein
LTVTADGLEEIKEDLKRERASTLNVVETTRKKIKR